MHNNVYGCMKVGVYVLHGCIFTYTHVCNMHGGNGLNVVVEDGFYGNTVDSFSDDSQEEFL